MTVYYMAIFLFIFAACGLVADTNVTSVYEDTYIDRAHSVISDKVVDYSDNVDIALSEMLKNSDENVTAIKINKKQSADAFFRSDKFFQETDETYVSVRLDSNFNSTGTSNFNIAVNARLPLSRSTKEYNLFINDLNQNNFNDIIKRESIDKQSRIEIGINYFAPLFYEMKSKYSIGTNGINPFVLARYTIRKKFYTWKIEPIQSFKYSLKDHFEEETKIYFDKPLGEFRLFRIDLHRSTKAKHSGMDYGLALEHYWILKDNTGLSVSQSFFGNTKYEYSTNNSLIPQETKSDGGITNYTTSLSYRRSVWRKWFFYGVTPNVNFQKQYGYKTNFGLNFFIDLYFGSIK